MSHVRQTILIAVLSLVASLAWSQESLQSFSAQPIHNPPQQILSSPSPVTSLLWSEQGLPAVGETPLVFSQSEQLPASLSDVGPRAVHQSSAKSPVHSTWHSDRFQHERLLFEEPKLERHGISRVAPVQLVESSTKFFTKSVLFPFAWAFGLHRMPESSK